MQGVATGGSTNYKRSAHANTMARRTSMKLQPAELSLTFPIDDSVSTSSTIDLSQVASEVNRRFYRAGKQWGVAGFTLHVSTGTGSIQIQRLPNTWNVGNGWEKAMRLWIKQQNDAIEEAGMESAVARFRDFKIYMDTTHVSAGFAANLRPAVYNDITNNWDFYLPGEWNPSLVVVPNQGGIVGNTQEYSLHMIGDDKAAPGGQSKGILKAYAESRAVPHSPDPATLPVAEDNLFTEMFNVGSNNEEIIDNAIDRNDNLPYPQMEYPGAELNASGLVLHDQLNITATTVSGKTKATGGIFPCGLMRLLISPTLIPPEGGETFAFLQVHLVPGNDRGYMTESMLEM